MKASTTHVLLEHELVVGEVVLVELRQKPRTKLKLPKKTIDEIEALLRESSVVEAPVKHLGLEIGDPDDEWVVASAVVGEAAVLKVAARAPLRIITPRGLWDLLREPTRTTRRRV